MSSKIADIAYGETEYIEPVIFELLNAPAISRLKGISQFGIPDKYYFKIGFSRYEHSVGVMNFLKKFGASTEEQIAGLIHDVSHFSFSHISDWIFSDGSKGNESYHDTQHNDFVLNTEIPNILAKYNYSIDRILDENNFPLLENELPDICADRIDYSLREIAHNGGVGEVSEIIRGLTKINDQIIFKDIKSALLFSNLFLDLQTEHWESEEGVVRYSLFSKAFKIAISIGMLVRDDFWDKTEEELLDILLKSDNSEILDILNRLETGDLGQKTGERVFKKFRYIDPLVNTNNKLTRLSKLDVEYSQKIKDARKQNALGVLV